MKLGAYFNKSFLSIIVFITSLITMYTEPFGIPAIKKYYADFILPDMKFGYTYEFIETMFLNLGTEGLRKYSYYYNVDLIFIIGLLGVQFSLLRRYKSKSNFINKLCMAFIVSRCLFDLMEDLIFILMIRGWIEISEDIVNTASALTEIKFIAMGLWAAVLVICIISGRFRVNKNA